MDFMPYDESTRVDFDLPTRSRLNELRTKFGEVEFRCIGPQEFCVRITSKIGGLEIPMAAIGETVYDAAAERLMRVTQTTEEA